MCTLGDVKTKENFWSFENFSSFWLILPESKLKVTLKFVGNEHPLETAFLWFCFNALPRLKFPNTEKLILLPSLRKCQKMENGQHCYSLGKRSNCSFLALPANTVMSWKVAGFLKSPLCLLFFRELYSGIFLKHRLSFNHTNSVPSRWHISWQLPQVTCAECSSFPSFLPWGALEGLALPAPPCVPGWEAWPKLGTMHAALQPAHHPQTWGASWATVKQFSGSVKLCWSCCAI